MRAGRGIETGEQALQLLEALVPEAVGWRLEADGRDLPTLDWGLLPAASGLHEKVVKRDGLGLFSSAFCTLLPNINVGK